MKTVEWNKEFDVGVELFNNQHKHLFEILKKLYAAMEDKNDKFALASIVNSLINYSREHFKAEEEYMSEYGFPKYEAHKKDHEAFINRVLKFAEDFKSDKQLLHLDILVFLKNWMFQHILVLDKGYKEFLNSKGIY